MREARLAVAAMILLLSPSGGCIGVAIPLLHPDSTNDCGHKPVTGDKLDALEPGATTRSDAVQAFGEPTWRLNDGRFHVYASVRHREGGVWYGFAAASLMGGGAAAGRAFFESDKVSFLLLEFDDRDLLVRSKLKGGSKGIRLDARRLDDVVR